MKKRLYVYGGLVVAVLLWWRIGIEPKIESGEWAPSEATVTAFDSSRWKWKNETHWIVSTTVDYLAKISGAKLSVVESEEGLRLESSPHRDLIEDDTFVWSPDLVNPELFAPNTLLPTEGLGEQLLKQLLNPSVESLKRANREVSKRLAVSSSISHDEAAMVLVAFALKESAGDFHDSRETLCRLSAHLAMAKATRGETGACGQLAEVFLEILAGRTVEGSKLLEQYFSNPQSDTIAAWKRIAILRMHADWRTMPKINTLSPLEQVEYIRALRKRIDASRALAEIKAIPDLPALTDWSRIIIDESTFYSPSVGAGAFVVTTGLKNEMRAAAVVMGIPFDSAAERAAYSAEELSRKLNGVVDDGLIISQPMWAAHIQRHFFAHAVVGEYFLRKKRGDAAGQRQFLKFMKPWVADMPMYPLVAGLWGDSNSTKRASTAFLETSPELVPFAAWFRMAGTGGTETWFQDWAPPGSAYNLANRHERFTSGKPWLGFMEAAIVRAPSSHYLCLQLAVCQVDQYQDVTELYGDYLAIDSVGLLMASRETGWEDTLEYLSIKERQAALDPNEYFSYGQMCAITGDENRAAAAYQKGFDLAPNRVGASNKLFWYTRYLVEQGKIAEARKIASYCANVYSQRGLRLAMWFHASQGEFSEAVKMAQAIGKRYGDKSQWAELKRQYPKLLTGLQRKRQSQYADKYLAARFPNGEQAYIAQATEPERGVLLKDGSKRESQSPYLWLFGLRHDDIVVAVDGIQVENAAQYQVLTVNNEFQLKMLVTVWRDGSYLTFENHAPARKLGMDLVDYKGR